VAIQFDAADDLNAWSANTEMLEVSVSGNPDGISETVVARWATPMRDAMRKFLRFRVGLSG
jgi:hypothetical protein